MPLRNSTSVLALLLGSPALLAGTAAHAQDASAGNETVVVTGSRLSTEGFTAPTPVTTIDATSITERAAGVITDVLNQLPQFRLTYGNGQQPTADFNGQNEIDLRGLGVNRTLVLLDGNRFVPTNNNSSVDINSIPVLLLSRVDTVTGGASAAYGSDAVAGVVNFVMRDRMEGIIGNVGLGISEQGDNLDNDYNIAAGHDFFGGRLHVIGSFEYTKNDGVSNEYSRPQEYGQQTCLIASTAAQRAAGLPSETYQNDCTYSQYAPSTLVTGGLTAAGTASTVISNLTFGPGGTVLPFNVGTVSGTAMYGGAPNPTDPHDNPRAGLQMEEPHKSVKFYDKMTFDIDADTSAWVQLNWADNITHSVNSGAILHTGIIIPITGPNANPYVPAALQAAAINDGLTALTVGRFELATGGMDLINSDATKRLAFGLKGKAFGDWSWDLVVNHGEATIHSYNIGYNLEANYQNSIFAVAGPSGTVVCGNPNANPNFAAGATASGRASQVQPGCQPYNIFGPTIDSYVPAGFRCFNCAGVPVALQNSPTGSQAAVNYFTQTNASGNHYQQDNIAGTVNGTPFSTWAGPAALAVGLEYRREGATAWLGPLGTAMLSISVNGSAYQGSFSTMEGFFELDTPFLKNEWFAEAADVDIAFRETGYSLFGTLPTYKVGVNWQISDDWRVRGTRSRDVREPSIQDLFAASSLAPNTSFTNPITHTTGIEYQLSGGNPNLRPENADSTTVGLIYTPTSGWFEGLNASIDYYEVKIEKVITTVNVQQIASQCATGVAAYCALVFPTGGPANTLEIETIPSNLANQKQSGEDLELSYTTPLDSFDLPGTLTTRLLATFTDYNITTSSVSRLEAAGSAQGQPKLQGSINLTYVLGPSATNLQMRYVSGSLADATLIGPGQNGYSPTLANSVNINQFPEQQYFDISENYDFYTSNNTKLTAFLNVNNLLNKDPPGQFLTVVAYLAGGDPYDLIGRTFKGGIRFKF